MANSLNVAVEEHGYKINQKGASRGIEVEVALEVCITLHDESKHGILLSILFQKMIAQCVLI